MTVLLSGLALMSPLWMALPGELLVDVEPARPADVALVLDGSSPNAMDGAEQWRQQGLVATVVLVEAPVKTHALTTYWSDLVRLGVARDSPTPPDRRRVVRAGTIQPAEQARAALPLLQEMGASSVLVPRSGLGSRLARREIARVLRPAGIQTSLSPLGPPARNPGRWYVNADDRRYVLGAWLQLLVPPLSGG